MANIILTPQVVAREALMILRNTLVAGATVYWDHTAEWTGGIKKSDTVKIRKPAAFEQKEFDPGAGIEIQNIDEGYVELKVEKHFDISLEVTSKEWTLELDQFSERVIKPVMFAHAQGLDAYILSKYVEINNFLGQGQMGIPPWALADIAQTRKALQNQKVPQDLRRYLIDPDTEAEYLVLDAIVNAEKSGSTDALRRASLGQLMGFDGIYASQNIPDHTPGTFCQYTDATAGTHTVGVSTINVTKTGAGSDKTIKKGDLLTIAGDTTQYVCTADATSSSDVIAVGIYPALKVATTGSQVVTFLYNGGNAYRNNLAFHRNGIAAVVVPLELPKGATNAEIINFEGIGVRVVYGYDTKYKKDIISFDFLAGAKVIQPELCVRQVGAQAAKPL